MTNAAFVALLGVLAAIAELGSKVADIATSRTRAPSGGSVGVRVVAIQPDPFEYPNAKQLRKNRILYAVLVPLAAYILVLSYQAYRDRSQVISVLLVGEGLYLLIAGVQGFGRLWGAEPGRPLRQSTVDVQMVGQRAEIVQDCMSAMVGIGAIKSEGTYMVEGDRGEVTIQGGTGPWPRRARGNRVTVLVAASSTLRCSVHISSETYRPALLDAYRNSKNVTRILRQLIVSAKAGFAGSGDWPDGEHPRLVRDRRQS
jgi:hypothetical protein